ncbi:FBP domain-containing protein [Homoserinibacter sp. GY 40078]|uniref:FBP domain-containing protein n=1 Tax=Homoserinibacter sp. GY 40078 TaxID=2603275 RepID=UPI0011C70A7B|nr:FBP domain-containing protein [Homoserinibacter sp. GY 40078]TXK17104.1 FBP domain-containing protein [Homoserinibacter sp. GY 40078]
MRPLTASEIRSSFVNAGSIDPERIPLPGLHEMLWDEREFLGWRDGSTAHRGYIVFHADDGPIGIVLRAAANRLPGGAAMCSLCQTSQPAGQVRLFSAQRAGDAGDAGDSVGTYICSDLGCSTLIRMAPHGSPWDPNPEAVVVERAASLLRRLEAFTAKVLAPRN